MKCMELLVVNCSVRLYCFKVLTDELAGLGCILAGRLISHRLFMQKALYFCIYFSLF